MAGDPAAAKKARAALLSETLERLRVRCPEAARPDDLEDYCRFLALKVAAKDWYELLHLTLARESLSVRARHR
ncbi:hypothetical protein AB1Y20_011856 [Prymnesium parvum]|uniref:Uncharacterized protein n=1 Tax=Prymnesium parvum TaxID=97485 RepID=A0AB34IHK4_PRYPA